jgi:hypothetical protein
LYDYLMAHRDGARYVAATSGWNSAGPFIMATGKPFLPMGGFSGSIPQPTLAAVQRMVSTGQLHYFLLGGGGLGGGGFGPGGGAGGSELSRITAWVTSTCQTVANANTQDLYRCA